jgi:hypothetical protein
VLDRFYPHYSATDREDTVLYVWAHPNGVPAPMDRMFFENLLRYLSDVDEGKRSLSLVQVMLMQYVAISRVSRVEADTRCTDTRRPPRWCFFRRHGGLGR